MKPTTFNYEDYRKLQHKFEDCRNELCVLCGRYREAHKGACNGCRWQEAEEIADDR